MKDSARRIGIRTLVAIRRLGTWLAVILRKVWRWIRFHRQFRETFGDMPREFGESPFFQRTVDRILALLADQCRSLAEKVHELRKNRELQERTIDADLAEYRKVRKHQRHAHRVYEEACKTAKAYGFRVNFKVEATARPVAGVIPIFIGGSNGRSHSPTRTVVVRLLVRTLGKYAKEKLLLLAEEIFNLSSPMGPFRF